MLVYVGPKCAHGNRRSTRIKLVGDLNLGSNLRDTCKRSNSLRHSVVRACVASASVGSKRAKALMDAFSGKLFRRVSFASLPPFLLRDRRRRRHAASIYGRVITRMATEVQGRIGSRGRHAGDRPLRGIIGSTVTAQEPKCKNHRQFECAWQMCNHR